MSDSRPRDLTDEDLALIQSPSARGAESAPLRVPPGIQVPIELWNPAAEISVAAAPSAEPRDVPTVEIGGPLPQGPPSARIRKR